MSQAVVTNYFTKKRRGGYIQPSKRLKLSNETAVLSSVGIAEATANNDIIVQPDVVVKQIRQVRTQSTRKKSTPPTQARRSSRRTRKNSGNNKETLSLDGYFNQNLDPVPESLDDITLRLSPSSSSGSSLSGSEGEGSEVITAAQDDHDIPVTPSKRQRKKQDDENLTLRQKRGRISPKKNNGFEFSTKERSASGELLPDLEFKPSRGSRRTARKKLLSSTDQEESNKEESNEEKSSKKDNFTTTSTKASKNIKINQNVEASKIEETSERKTQKNATRKGQKEEIEQSKPVRKTRSRKNAENTDEAVSEKSATLKKSEKLAKKLLAKKLDSPDSVKQALKGSNKLKDLQETLMKMRDQKKKIQEKEKMKQKEKVKVHKEVKVHEKREFAYETLHNLAQQVPKGLPLPFKYKILAEMFRCSDTVVGMLFNRQQNTTWSSLQKSVKDMIRKNFELSHLGQIKSVFPAAYKYRQEKGIISYADHNIRPSDYQLTIEPILDERECDQFGDGSRKLTSSMMVKRRHHFLVQLVDIVKQHHKKFLSTLDPPIEVQDDQILRWHPQFPLDRVPELEISDFPKPPNHERDKCNSAKDVLEKARSRFTKKAVDALKKVAEKASLTPEKSKLNIEENNNITPTKTKTPTKPVAALKGVSQSLLAKIRAKEAEKKMKSMVRSEHDDKKLQQLVKLPDVARALRMLFVTEKKAALQMEYICEKLTKCCTGILSPSVVLEHVDLLVEHLPSWVSKTKVRNLSYVKMNKTKEMSEIINEIQAKIKQAEKA